MAYQTNSNEFRQLVNEIRSQLKESDYQNIIMLLDNRELGIAFQELIGSIVDDSIVVTKSQKECLVTLYSKMNGDSNPFWKKIKLKEHIEKMKTE
ncbi:MAG: MafI family immunity protein [Bdellovibrionia bacterium]